MSCDMSPRLFLERVLRWVGNLLMLGWMRNPTRKKRNPVYSFCSSTGREKYSFAVLLGWRNQALQFHWDEKYSSHFHWDGDEGERKKRKELCIYAKDFFLSLGWTFGVFGSVWKFWIFLEIFRNHPGKVLFFSGRSTNRTNQKKIRNNIGTQWKTYTN